VTKRNRDDFLQTTVRKVATRAGWLCSFPGCRAFTVGADLGEGIINIGTAAHICAAAPGGPRYDENMSPQERSSANNGIWMCRDHGKAIDSADPEFTVERLREWKSQAEQEARQRVLRNERSPIPEVTTDAQLLARIRTAAEADLDVFKRTSKWPPTLVALTLKVDGFSESVDTFALARAVTTLDDLILIAPPGMGKTTTLMQIADGLLAVGNGAPLVLPLGDWATENATVLDSILNRPAYREISEEDFRQAAAQPGLVLLLDGWNELDAESRKRARFQINTLKAELPALGLVISTRKQMLDVPFEGMHIDLLPLNEDQQIQIATQLRGASGEKIVDQAWRTAGVRELVTIPLYLVSLLSLPKGVPFPTTKEEVLRCFVDAHEREPSHAENLHAVVQGFQQDYLENLAVLATRLMNTAIADRKARQSISETQTLLADSGQITSKPQPDEVLEVLVSNHVIMRAGDVAGYSFQHQQFQEWYASHFIERLIIHEAMDPKGREALKAEVFDMPSWEEAILFAVERLARGDAHQNAMCGEAIIAAFEVDPILAAEMIYRSTDEVWVQIADAIQGLVARWHVPGKADRAFRFMLTSGRPEFFDKVWPLITDENRQVRLDALRKCRQFRPSILGRDAEKKITSLTKQARAELLSEMAHNSGMEGLDLASNIAKDDPDPEVQASVVNVLAFRRADHHIALVLEQASDETFDRVASKGLLDEVKYDHVIKGITAARKRKVVEGTPTYARLHEIAYTKDDEDRSAELIAIISSMEIERQDTRTHIIFEAHNRYPSAVSDGLLARLRAGHTLFYGTDSILASTKLSLEDDELLQLALTGHGDRPIAAASVLGPNSAGIMLDEMMDLKTRLRDAKGKLDKATSSHYRDIELRIAHLPAASLVGAVQMRSAQADNERMADLAELLSHYSERSRDSVWSFDEENLATIRTLAQDWGNRMLASGNATRWQLLRIAMLASQAPDVSLLPLLKRMLDDNILRYRAFLEEAKATAWRQGNAVDEARHPMMLEYQRAFLSIDAPETAVLMDEYLTDPHFGEFAAGALVQRWVAAHEPPPDNFLFGGVDFRHVGEKRAACTADPNATTDEAEAIFAAIEPLIADGATEDQKKRAIALGIAAVRIPHGRRDETIEKLIAMTPWRARANLLLNLILSGAEVDSKLAVDGLIETLEAAKKESWILTQSDGFELRNWLRLLPFTNRPEDALEAVCLIPVTQRQPSLLVDLVGGLAETPSDGAEETLFRLAEDDPRLYQDRKWRSATLKLGTKTAAYRLIDLTVNGAFDGRSLEDWYWSGAIGKLIVDFPEVRQYVYGLLNDGVTSRPLALLARAITESPDTEGVLLLTKIENNQGQSILGYQTIEKVVTEHVPAENWRGAYNIVPAPAVELRRQLLAMTTDGGPTDAATHCLRIIDDIRDEYGIPVSESRHPDLASSKPWPIIPPDL